MILPPLAKIPTGPLPVPSGSNESLSPYAEERLVDRVQPLTVLLVIVLVAVLVLATG